MQKQMPSVLLYVVCMDAYICVHICVYVYIYIYIYIYIHVCICIFVHVGLDLYSYMPVIKLTCTYGKVSCCT